eukprot:TRINITY_DN12472_c0_g1_i1.p1 TRINITY_DN12472_c0_g1~~TRINITY_DN12472_c0_g1_i1.p1  ORF type:complete len:456 (-),score=102.76 TRINITY_DN12472_c0_g1_i1:59-1426(-)
MMRSCVRALPLVFPRSALPLASHRRFLSSPIDTDPHVQTNIMFAVDHKPGALQQALDVLGQRNINMTRIESRPSKTGHGYDFYVDFSTPKGTVQDVGALVAELKTKCERVDVLNSYEVPWFPRKIKDLDTFSSRVLGAGAELDSDHPGFTDPEYRARRQKIAEIAINYRHGQPIPRVDYTANEVATWGSVFNKLTALYPTHACREHNYVFPLLVQNCGYRADNIPQLQDISEFLKDSTGFSLRPVSGLLSSRDFLNGLAFRVFHSTQYIRHHSKPLYTPEPDICHELLGHVPLFADPDFADFSHEIGLASIGASDEEVKRLATCYWFTVEFGLCRQDGKRKAFGAGLLSSFGELEYSLSDQPEVRPFDPFLASKQDYPITTYQPIYWEAASFAAAKEQMRSYGESLSRPFAVHFNPYSQNIEILDNNRALLEVAKRLDSDAKKLVQAFKKGFGEQ